MDTKIWHLIFAIGFLIPIKAESAEVCKLQPVQRASSVEIPSAVMILTQSRAVVEHGNGTTFVYDCEQNPRLLGPLICIAFEGYTIRAIDLRYRGYVLSLNTDSLLQTAYGGIYTIESCSGQR